MNKQTEFEIDNGVQETFAFLQQDDGASNVSGQASNNPEQWLQGSYELNNSLTLSVDELPNEELTEIVCLDSLDSVYALLPALSHYCEQERWVTLVAPPTNLDKRMFALYGIDPSRVLMIHPRDMMQDCNAMNKALKNGKSGIVILWGDKIPNRFLAQWRKSVKQGGCCGVWVNLSGKFSESSSIALSACLVSSVKYVKLIMRKQFGVVSNWHSEVILPKLAAGYAAHTNDSQALSQKLKH